MSEFAFDDDYVKLGRGLNRRYNEEVDQWRQIQQKEADKIALWGLIDTLLTKSANEQWSGSLGITNLTQNVLDFDRFRAYKKRLEWEQAEANGAADDLEQYLLPHDSVSISDEIQKEADVDLQSNSFEAEFKNALDSISSYEKRLRVVNETIQGLYKHNDGREFLADMLRLSFLKHHPSYSVDVDYRVFDALSLLNPSKADLIPDSSERQNAPSLGTKKTGLLNNRDSDGNPTIGKSVKLELLRFVQFVMPSVLQVYEDLGFPKRAEFFVQFYGRVSRLLVGQDDTHLSSDGRPVFKYASTIEKGTQDLDDGLQSFYDPPESETKQNATDISKTAKRFKDEVSGVVSIVRAVLDGNALKYHRIASLVTYVFATYNFITQVVDYDDEIPLEDRWDTEQFVGLLSSVTSLLDYEPVKKLATEGFDKELEQSAVWFDWKDDKTVRQALKDEIPTSKVLKGVAAFVDPILSIYDLVMSGIGLMKANKRDDTSVMFGHAMMMAGAGVSLVFSVIAFVIAIGEYSGGGFLAFMATLGGSNPIGWGLTVVLIATSIIAGLIVSWTQDADLETFLTNCYFGQSPGEQWTDPSSPLFRTSTEIPVGKPRKSVSKLESNPSRQVSELYSYLNPLGFRLKLEQNVQHPDTGTEYGYKLTLGTDKKLGEKIPVPTVLRLYPLYEKWDGYRLGTKTAPFYQHRIPIRNFVEVSIQNRELVLDYTADWQNKQFQTEDGIRLSSDGRATRTFGEQFPGSQVPTVEFGEDSADQFKPTWMVELWDDSLENLVGISKPGWNPDHYVELALITAPVASFLRKREAEGTSARSVQTALMTNYPKLRRQRLKLSSL